MAKRTYTGTFFYLDNLEEATVELYISNTNKYDRGSRIYMAGEEPEDEIKREFTGLKSWTIVEGGAEAEAIEQGGLVPWTDENHEYLILNFENGESRIYRNSYVTMFIH